MDRNDAPDHGPLSSDRRILPESHRLAFFRRTAMAAQDRLKFARSGWQRHWPARRRAIDVVGRS